LDPGSINHFALEASSPEAFVSTRSKLIAGPYAGDTVYGVSDQLISPATARLPRTARSSAALSRQDPTLIASRGLLQRPSIGAGLGWVTALSVRTRRALPNGERETAAPAAAPAP
jgi:hypothetical protein